MLKKVTDLSEDPIAQLATNDLKDPIRNSKQTPTEALTASTKVVNDITVMNFNDVVECSAVVVASLLVIPTKDKTYAIFRSRILEV